MTQILRGTPATLELLVYNNGDPADLEAEPDLTVTDSNGATITPGSVSKPSTGTYRSTVDGQEDLKTLKAVWSGVLAGSAVSFIQRHEIVGSLLFTEAQARARTITGQQTPLADADLYPDSAIARMRDLLTEAFERETGRSWIRRYCRVELTGNGQHVISLAKGEPRDVDGDTVGGPGRLRHIAKPIAASINGDPVDTADLKVSGRNIIHTAGVWPKASIADPYNIIIEYEYGAHPVPVEANENGLIEAVKRLQASDVSASAQSFSTPTGATTFPPGGYVWAPKTFQWLKRHRPVLLA